MSQCQAVNCEIYSSQEIKDFNGCNTLQNLTPPICKIGPTTTNETLATCAKRSGSLEVLQRTPAQCNISEDVNNPQRVCEEISGCEWTYTTTTAGTANVFPIKKMCQPKNDRSYTCSEKFGRNNSRYGYIDSDTFGCDKTTCDYTPKKKSLEPGQCIGADGNTECNGKIKTQCLNDDTCIWKPNDEEFCGYNRNIEYYIEKINNDSSVSDHIYNIGDIDDITTTDIDNVARIRAMDPCLRIQHPSRENCELEGCIWDINGSRATPNDYNKTGSAPGAPADPFYYDINTSGICTTPVAEKCMDYFCSRSSELINGREPNYKLPDGVCINDDVSSNNCSTSGKHIIEHKTPGLITFLPNNRTIYPEHLTRNNWGHQGAESTNITNLNNLLGKEYTRSKDGLGAVTGKDLILQNFQKHYKENCENNLIYPTSYSDATYDINNNKKQYDEDTDICSNSNETINTNGRSLSDSSLCDSFYHKDKAVGDAYTISNSCQVFDTANITISNDRATASADIDSIILPHTLHTITNVPDAITDITTAAGLTARAAIFAGSQADISNNLVCNRKFLEIISQIKTNLLEWDDYIYYLREDPSDPVTITVGEYNSNLSITKTNDTTLLSTLFSNFGRGSPMIPSPPTTNKDYYPINQIGAGLLINSFVYRAKADITGSTLADYQSSLFDLFGEATISSDPVNTATWTPDARGKIVSNDIKTKIEARILNIANKVQFGLISYEEYLDELSRFIASLLVYNGSGADSSVKCAYDTFNNTYSSYTTDASAGAGDVININNITFEALNDHLQVKSGDQAGSTINYYDLIGKSADDGTSLEQNISTTHSIKDIVHRKGTAILTFQLYDDSDNKIEMTDAIKNQFFTAASGTITSIYFDKTGSRTPPDDSLKITQNADNDEKIFDINDDDTNVYKIIGVPKIYIGGILEIEVDNIEPGCLGDMDSSNTCKSNIYMINSNDDYTSTNGSNKLSLKEIRLKDNPIDIYFNGDIDGLYRKNEIISINGLENNTFNNNLTFDDTSYYQIISEVDTINNRITIKNGTRKGKYFLGREELENNNYNDPDNCRNVSYSGDPPTMTSTQLTADNIKYCDSIHEIYKYCKGLTDSSAICTGDDLCDYNGSDNTCLPIETGTNAYTDNTKCYEINANFSNSNLKPTRCPYDSTDGFGYESKSFYIEDANQVTISKGTQGYTLNNIIGIDQKTSSFLNDWRIEYLDASGEKIVGKIHSHNYSSGDDLNSTIKIKRIDNSVETEEEGTILIISIRPPKNAGTGALSSATQFDKPSIVTINSYLKKEVSVSSNNPSGSDNVITNKLMCDFNNGVWENRKCYLAGKDIRGIDLCENTGYIFDQNNNICYKEYDGAKNINDTLTYNNYCSNKTNKKGGDDSISEKVNWTANNTSSQEDKRPCSVCSFITEVPPTGGGPTNHYCAPLTERDCLKMSKDQCESPTTRPDSGGVPLSSSSSCEFYRHNMDHENIEINGTTKQIRFADFDCEQQIIGDSNTCNTHQRYEDCEPTNTNNPTGCEWKCPYSSDDNLGYNIFLTDEVTRPTLTDMNGRDQTTYYSKSELNVTCDTANGWQAIDSNTTPRAQCTRNPNDNTRGDHPQVMGYLGCIKSLMCKNDIYTSETINNMPDERMIPSEFKTNGVIDPIKRPNEDGSFRCPLPKSLKSNPEGISGWSEEICCQSVGLCSGNDISANDVTCPVGQQIKQTYYGENTSLQSEIGTSVSECCEAPEAPTITQIIELTNSVGNIVDESSSESQEFRNQFIQDLLTILNNSNSDIGFTITADMISILDVIEPFGNNIEVTFKILKNSDGNVVNKDKLTRLLVPGTSFTRVGGVANTSPHFRPYDPKSKYLYYSEKFKKGITIEEVGISVFLTFSLCAFCLVILGILLK